MHELSNQIAYLIVKPEENKDSYEMVSYGLEAILTSLTTTIFGIILSIIFHYTYEFLIFSICFIPIRMMHKSFHFKTFSRCFICSNIMLLICSLTIKYLHINKYILVFLFPTQLYIHYQLSIEKNKYVQLLIGISFALTLFIDSSYTYAITIALIMNTILMIGGKVNAKHHIND